jgi:hypothetical protein
MAESTKMRDCTDIVPWYNDMGTHGSVNCIYIPSSKYVCKEKEMCEIWTKKDTGEAIHNRWPNVRTYIYKLILPDGVLPKGYDELRNVMMAAMVMATMCYIISCEYCMLCCLYHHTQAVISNPFM